MRFFPRLLDFLRNLMKRKPRKCRKCGTREFLVFTESQYRAQIDGRNRHVITTNIIEERIRTVKCTRCGNELEPETLEFDIATLAA